jgi:hypothetical protein
MFVSSNMRRDSWDNSGRRNDGYGVDSDEPITHNLVIDRLRTSLAVANSLEIVEAV